MLDLVGEQIEQGVAVFGQVRRKYARHAAYAPAQHVDGHGHALRRVRQGERQRHPLLRRLGEKGFDRVTARIVCVEKQPGRRIEMIIPERRSQGGEKSIFSPLNCIVTVLCTSRQTKETICSSISITSL